MTGHSAATVAWMLAGCGFLLAQTPEPRDPGLALPRLFNTHDVVLFGELHTSRQQYELLERIILSPEFVHAVDDIVIEFGNALYQDLVDRYVLGGEVAENELQRSWRNTLALGLTPDATYVRFFRAVRQANQSAPQSRKIRVVCGDPPVDWSKVHQRSDLEPFVPVRPQHYAKVVRREVIDKKRKALLIMGSGHFRRSQGEANSIERELRRSGASTYVVLVGSNIVGTHDQLEPRLTQWKWPWLAPVRGTWLAGLPAQPILMGGTSGDPFARGTLGTSADAFLFLGPNEELTQVRARRSEVIGSDYARETERRLTIIFGRASAEFLPADDSGEIPQFPRARKSAPPIPTPKSR
ncbi:MAG TPA: hypothetical protein VFL57_11380 [Bryobacteraceae bacterium]|nr:hypothetical protein [Bryobacteraceae bacterium]